jgi:hypothetical protein
MISELTYFQIRQNLESEKVLQRIEEALQSHPYSAGKLILASTGTPGLMCAFRLTLADVGFPGLRHFVCKSRKNVQITSPRWEAPYAEDGANRHR